MSDKIKMPDLFELYTADEVSECIEYQKHLPTERASALSRALWQFLADAKNPTPLGGDGSNGTVETPGERLSLENDDKAAHWWDKLDRDWQEALVKSAEDMERR